MKTNWFRKLRERQWKKKLEKVGREAAAKARRHIEIMERAKAASARFLAAERIGAPPDMLQKLGAEAAEALAEMHAMQKSEIAEIADAVTAFDQEKKHA